MISECIVEQHIHGAFEIDFMSCSVDELLFLSEKLLSCGVGYFFPTIMTDEISNIKNVLML